MTIRRALLCLAVVCSLLHSSVQDASPHASPHAAPDPTPDASPQPSPAPEASPSPDAFQYQGAPPHFGFHDGGSYISSGGISGPRSLGSSSTHHVSSGSEHSHCALLIPGHGGAKSSHFDHTFGGFNGIHSGGGDGVTCITFQSVDAAFSKARDRLGLPRPEKVDNAEQRSELGAVLLETTRIIAKEYHLPKDVIVNGLPLIDTHKTIIGTVCSDFTRPGPCKVTKYRTVSGRCNNLDNPHWGTSLSTFKRFLLPEYEDGLDQPKMHSKHGWELPSPRIVSAHVHRDEGLHDHAITIMAVAWGQAIDHDMTLTAETKLPGTSEDPKCCGKDRNFPECFPIIVPDEDPFYSLFKQNCISLTRSRPGLTHKCKLGPRTQINEVSSFLDANWVYGNNEKIANRIRLFKGGLMKALPVFREFGLKDMLPLKLDDPSNGCIRPNNEVFCFDAGDNRVNEQLVLAVIHTLFMREHNKLVIGLSKINPHWDDEKLYQEGRSIVAAIIQHVTYNEFLPMILGKEMMQKHGLILNKHGYYDGYNPKIDGSVTSQFITASFRFGHSLLPSTIERWSPNHKYIASQRLSEMLRQPYDLYKGGWCDQYIMGLCNQVAQAMDDAVSQEVTNHLFQEPNKKFGMDLAAINMQRAREHGVPSYNDFREFCGMPRIHSWSDLGGWMANKTVKRYSDVYRHPDDMDLWSGGVSERPLPGSMVGPTFSCLIGLSFKDLRAGDRFWYENPGHPSSFSPHQLEEIRKVKLSRVICDNSDDIKKIQVYVMVLPDHDINPRVPCNSGVLPHMDLTKWADSPHHHHGGGSHHVSGDHLQSLNLPPGTRKHFNNPGSSDEILGGAAPNLLNVGPPIGDFNSLGGGIDGHHIESIGFSSNGFDDPGFDDPGFDDHGFDDATFGHHQSINLGEIHNMDTNLDFSSIGDGFHGKPESSYVSHHDDGVVPHHDAFHGHNDVQYGTPSHLGDGKPLSTGFSDFAIGGFGPIKDDTLLHGGNMFSSPHGGGSYQSIHSEDGTKYIHHDSSNDVGPSYSQSSSSFKPIHGPAISSHSHGSIPYAQSPSYGGHSKPYASPPVVIPIRPKYNRPHRGKGGKGGGYFKKFMGMFGY